MKKTPVVAHFKASSQQLAVGIQENHIWESRPRSGFKPRTSEYKSEPLYFCYDIL